MRARLLVAGACALVVAAARAAAQPAPALLALGGQAAGAEPPAAQPAPQPTLPARLAPDARATIERLADSLRVAGVPWEPLYAKAAEGVLKGADDARIVAVVRVLARELGEARATLGARASSAEIVGAASALHAGVPAATLVRLQRVQATPRAAGERGGLALSFLVLADLASRGIAPGRVAGTLGTLLERGASDAELAAFRAGVERDLLAGRRPDDALAARATTTLRALDAGRRGTP